MSRQRTPALSGSDAPPTNKLARALHALRRIPAWALNGFPQVFPRALKYQVLTKAFMVIAVLPLYGLATQLLAADQGAVTNATLGSFLLSWRGLVALTLTLALFLFAFAIEVLGYVVITARSMHGQPEASYRAVVRLAFSRLKNLLGVGGVLIVIYLALVVPLGGLGAGVSFLRELRVPNFIAAVIETDTLYSVLYAAVVGLLLVVGALLIYTPHLIVICNLRAGPAMRASARLVRQRPRLLLVDVLGRGLVAVLLLGAIVLAWWLGVGPVMDLLGADSPVTKSLFAGLLLTQYAGAFLLLLVEVPFEVNLVTRAFYRALATDEELSVHADRFPEVEAKTQRSWLDRAVARWRRFAAAAVALAVPVAVVMGLFFEEIFSPFPDVEIVAHRAGGFARPENSLSGLRHAIDTGVHWVEVDVQRTRDGHYVLNHDDTFARVAGTPRAARDLTLAEVKQLNIGHEGVERVPELTEFLTAAKGRVKVILELKGVTADRQMADDVVALVHHLDMADQTMVMSLDYGLITYLDEAHPDIDTGFAYFLSFGDVTRLAGDYLILEEGQASAARLFQLGITDKKTMVWTVNTFESMERFTHADVSAIITDDPEMLRFKLDEARNESNTERFLRLFLGVPI